MSGRSQQAVLAEGLARQGQMGPAVAACYQALRIDESDVLIRCVLGEVMLSGDFYEEAIIEASRAIEIDPGCVPAYFTLGLAYDRRGGMWDRSILVWHELAEVVPDLVTAHVQLGEALAAAAFEKEAIDAWRRALEIDSTEARAMYNLAVAALKREGLATALPGFRKAGELDPSQDALFFSLADVTRIDGRAGDVAGPASDRAGRMEAAYRLALQEEYFAAADLIRLVLDEDPDDAEALGLAAYLYLKQEATNEAIACALRALTVSAQTPTAVYCLGVAFTRQPGLARHAVRVFSALARAVPREPMPHVLVAESLLVLRRFSAARKSYGTALELDPSCVRARFGMAAVLLTEGRHAEADWEIRRAAYHDTRRQGLFWGLYDAYAEGRASPHA